MKRVFCCGLLCWLVVGTVLGREAPDSVIVQAAAQYKLRSGLQQVVLGTNYRREWTTPVKMPVFDITKEQGGLKVLKLGGGMQTQSLRLQDSAGYKWVLRSVNKDVSKLFPAVMRSSPVRSMTQDMISASHPYAAIVVSALCDAVGIMAPHPRLVFVKPDSAFGEYAQLPEGVYFFEERSPTHNHRSYGIDEIRQKLQMDSDKVYVLMQKEFLKARLLDMLVADWDRHEGQYRFGIKDSAGKKWIYPVPVDRDQAFFNGEGAFAGVAKLFTPFLGGYHDDPGNLRKLNYKAHKFDRFLMGGMSAQDWEQAITELQAALTDGVIDNAVKQLPPEIYPLSGRQIAATLKNRRNALHAPAMKYYSFVSRRD